MPAKRSIPRRTISARHRYSKPPRQNTTGSTASLPWPPADANQVGRFMRYSRCCNAPEDRGRKTEDRRYLCKVFNELHLYSDRLRERQASSRRFGIDPRCKVSGPNFSWTASEQVRCRYSKRAAARGAASQVDSIRAIRKKHSRFPHCILSWTSDSGASAGSGFCDGEAGPLHHRLERQRVRCVTEPCPGTRI